ncbi:MAG TPA: efflux RND transporter periplasmic adaptor subunit [Myxococcota bacterium]|nr:efflux RND transporter periplasmic adaptor subunit [Myxococcota bacterium]
MNKTRLALTLPLAALVALACSGKKQDKAVAAPNVSLGDAANVDLDDRIEATGELVSPNHAMIAAEVGGRVTAIFINEGKPAPAGDRVLEIDPERRELDLRAAKAGASEAQAGLADQQRAADRVNHLFKSNVASKAQLDTAETQLESARSRADAAAAQLGQAERARRDAEVKAPFGGFVAQRFVSVGEFVQPGTKLFELVALDPIEVEFRVAEVDSSRVRMGQVVDVRVAPFPDEKFQATVTLVSPMIDPATRTLRVKGTLANPDGKLRPGLFARADLGVSHREAVLMIPDEAVLERSDGKVVFRLAGADKVERRVVKTGVHKNGKVEITEGLANGDKVVIRGHTALVDGAVVAVRNADGSVIEPDVASGAAAARPPERAE